MSSASELAKAKDMLEILAAVMVQKDEEDISPVATALGVIAQGIIALTEAVREGNKK